MQGYTFAVQGLDNCPPADAEPVSCIIYRGVRNIPPQENDFLSHKEAGIKCRGPECQCWGSSVWLTREAVEHARMASPWVRQNLHIVEFQSEDSDGVIMATPNKQQPQHHTYWRNTTKTFSSRCNLVLNAGTGFET